ncbi:hypothetical protein Ade02nite_87630 [Paractinoplanes deccanensis]|uniref:Uncharacterized protein n=1 Tax=Paractinoplanes deccanensis TaxID=113561 RepID=A0ABQ3YJG5_9ACTN|nr:hypothetical protein Ade02nite_87630 [Actinoplanes deccanensis]
MRQLQRHRAVQGEDVERIGQRVRHQRAAEVEAGIGHDDADADAGRGQLPGELFADAGGGAGDDRVSSALAGVPLLPALREILVMPARLGATAAGPGSPCS